MSGAQGRNEAPEATPDLLRRLPLPDPGGDKEERGRVLVIGGGVEIPGAVLLAATAALRAGAGKLQIATGRGIAPHLAIAMPEARVVGLPETAKGGIAPESASLVLADAGACDAVVVGPGMVDPPAARALTARLLEELDGPALVLDAAALPGLPDRRDALRRHGGRVVVTPHFGEMAGMLDMKKEEVAAHPLATAKRAAVFLGVVVVLKGPRTWIATPEGEAWMFRGGCVGLGTSGSGDVLAGVVGGLLARGADPARAALWAVHLHGAAGRRLTERQGRVGFLAREIAAEIPRLLAETENGGALPPLEGESR